MLEFTNALVHTIVIILGLGYLTLESVSISIHFQAKFKIFFPLSSTLITRSVTISLFILPLTGCLRDLAITIKTVMNIVEQMFLLDDWASLGYIPKSGIAGSLGKLTTIFLRYSHSLFQSSCITLQTHQQEISVSLTPHTLQKRLSLVFLI